MALADTGFRFRGNDAAELVNAEPFHSIGTRSSRPTKKPGHRFGAYALVM